MPYRTPARAPDPDDPDVEQETARLDGELREARVRTRRLMQAAGVFSIFLYLKMEPFGWIPAGVVHFGYSLWAALLLTAGASLFDEHRTGCALNALKRDG